ncbi:hypothetical protein N5J66_25390 [Pseudomonas juntendi]|nr:hypothetical protein [Pseudomonas juntendi]MDH2017301.1 hypothetical protein [Pseudomonas juntendi]
MTARGVRNDNPRNAWQGQFVLEAGAAKPRRASDPAPEPEAPVA